MSNVAKLRLGDRLLQLGLINERQLDVALSEQKRFHRPLGDILVSLGFVRDEDVARILAADMDLPFLSAQDVEPDPVLLASIDREFVRSASALPIGMQDGALRVVMVHPDDPENVAAVRARFPFPLQIAVTTDADLSAWVRLHLADTKGRVAEIFEGFDPEGNEWPVERITAAILVDAVHRGATDIHIEPEDKVTRVRYRIDGVLVQAENLPRDATEAVISRIKVLADLDIAERRRPQDGRLGKAIDNRQIDMRVSIMPCVHGENVVIRILDSSQAALSIGDLGIAPAHQVLLRRIADRTHGLFLVTGPTGSGKTTTLYSVLAEMDAMQRNVATVEDPVEYRMPLLRQTQVDASIGFGFSEGLRSLLRQDPDVILVGEIRDQETASMAIKASMTGHLVLSTLHTNSAIGAVPRLTDLGVDPFLVEDSLIGALAQRLVRKVCAFCAEPAELGEQEMSWLGQDRGAPRVGRGCARCGDSGYLGRTAICEVFLPDDDMADPLRGGVDAGTLFKIARKRGFETMEDDGRAKVRAGVTTYAEVQRVNRSHRFTDDERQGV